MGGCGKSGVPDAVMGIKLVSSEPVRDRITDLSFQSPLLDREAKVRVMLPTDYDASGRTRYPVLYLLHGAGVDGYAAWTEGQQADGTQGQLQDLLADGTKTSETEAMTAGLALIVVMPESGKNGGYIDWYNAGNFGPPAWESFHLGELLPWIDAHYPTLAARNGRAVAGFSMGGYGAMHYAARHPDLFVAAAGFSPAVDKTDPLVIANNSRGDPTTELLGADQDSQGSLLTNMVYIRGHNPMDLAQNLAGVALTLRTGNGLSGLPPPLGEGSNRPDPVEAGVFEQAERFHEQLASLGIEHIWEAKAGAHTRSFAELKLRDTLPWLMDVFTKPPSAPARVTYRSIDLYYEVFGWSVSLDRPAREFSELRNADASGFDLLGSGSAVVTTPAGYFSPGTPLTAELSSDDVPSTGIAAKADDQGRLQIPIELGPGNPYDEYSGDAAIAGTRVYAVHVKLPGAGG